MSNPTSLTVAQREANTELFLEDNAEFLLDPSELWCRPAIAFARWDAKDTEGLRGDGERDIARNFAIKQILLDQTFKTFSMPSIDMHYLADLIVSHFEEVYSGESAEAFTNDPEITDGEEIPFDAPAPQPPAEQPLFDTIDAMLRSHFGLPPVIHTPPAFPLREQFPGVDFVRVTGYWNTLSRSRFVDHLCAIIPEDAPDGVWEELAGRDDVFHLFNDGEAIVGKHYDFTITEATLV